MSPIAIYPASCYQCDVILIMTSRSPRDHYGVILIVTSFATELLATPTVMDERTYIRYGHLTAFNI